uniref:Ground-like domain-containing protein n=1 Tax=Globodera rostochiensis TaxID=31243 RepID=A0A914H552_GLORO
MFAELPKYAAYYKYLALPLSTFHQYWHTMPFICRLSLLLLLIFHTFLLITDGLGLGGGCGCPCMPQPCLPQIQVPPIALPSLCLPQIPLPCPPPKCGCCCGRKKRGAVESKVGSTGAFNDGQKHCNDPQIRRIILKNLVVGDPVNSKAAIHSELRAKLGGDYIVLCSQAPSLSFAADSTSHYCLEGHNALGCAVFEL